MKFFRRSHLFRRSIAAAVAALFLQACMHWSARPVTPQALPETGASREYRVTLIGGFQMVMQHPFISGDSLLWLGQAPGTASTLDQPPTHVGVPLSQVVKVEVRAVDPAATTVAVFVTLGIAAVIIAAAVAGNSLGGSSGGGGSGGSGGGGGGCDACASCPLVYSWDGAHWRLDSGTFGGAILRVLERTDVDNLDVAAPVGGRLRLKVANQLNETDYLDAVDVLAVDHDPDVAVAPDGAGRLYTLGALEHPSGARDFKGHDALAQVQSTDGWNWESYPAERDTAAVGDIRDGLEVAFVRPQGVATANLVVDGNNTTWAVTMLRDFIAAHGRGTEAWYDSLESAPQRAQALMQAMAREGFLGVSVWAAGTWEPQGYLWDVGPEIAKRQVMSLDLARVTGDTVRLRLESAPSFWQLDQVALDFSPQRPMRVTAVSIAQAVDGRGRDARELLTGADHRPLTLETGDTALLQFAVPPVPEGRARSYLLRSTGWYHVHTPEQGAPAADLLAQLQSEPHAMSRLSVARMNAALGAMRLAAQDPAGQ